jgi:hypothetical protein
LDLSALSVLAVWAPFILIFGGFVAVAKALGSFRKDSAGTILKTIGFFVGILLLVTGIIVLFGQAESWEIWVLLGLTGLGLVLKPLSKISFSALLGLLAGLLCVGLLYFYFPLPVAVLGVSSFWVYLIVFLVPAFAVWLVFKFVETLGKLIGAILGSWLVLTVLGSFCIVEGTLLLVNQSLLSLLA